MAFVTIMLLTDRTGLILPLFISIIIHETGHLFAMWLYDCAPKSICFIPASLKITRGFSLKKHGELTIMLFGPVSNFIVFMTLYLNYLSTQNQYTLNVALINLLLCIYNLLPLKGLDGGSVLYILISKRHSVFTADKVLRTITFLSSVIIFAVAILLAFLNRFNLSTYIIALYLLIISLNKS